jgi:hypothetical protein
MNSFYRLQVWSVNSFYRLQVWSFNTFLLQMARSRGLLGEVARWVGSTGEERSESYSALLLGRAMSSAIDGLQGGEKTAALAGVWDQQWQSVYGLADRVCARYMREASAIGSARGFAEETVARL